MAIRLFPILELRAKFLRIAFHAIVWILIWAILRYFSVPSLTRDNDQVVQHAAIAILIQSVVVFYFLGSVAFPRFLYPGKIPELIVCVLLLFQLIHISNYYEIKYLSQISDANVTGESMYVSRFWKYLYSLKSWTSCFTDFQMAYLNYAWSLFYVTPILAVKVMRDIIFLRTQNLRLERDRLQLEKNNLDLQSESLKLQRDNLNLELSFLKAQINPHFLFNTLNAIYVKTTDLDDHTADLVMRLSNLMRYSLYESNRDKVVLTRETDYIESYVALEKARFGDKVEIRYHVEGPTDRYYISPLLLISFVENAFKHGTGRTTSPSYVHISIVLEDFRLSLMVKNSIPQAVNGQGRPARTNENVGGFGLVSTTKRLHLLYPEKHSLVIDRQEAHFEVRLRLDLQQIS